MSKYIPVTYDDPEMVILCINDINVSINRQILMSITYFEALLSEKYIDAKSDAINITIDFLPENTDISLLMKDIFHHYWSNCLSAQYFQVHYMDSILIHKICDFFGIDDHWIELIYYLELDEELSSDNKLIILKYIDSSLIQENNYVFDMHDANLLLYIHNTLNVLFPGIIQRLNIIKDILPKILSSKNIINNGLRNIITDTLIWVFIGDITKPPTEIYLNIPKRYNLESNSSLVLGNIKKITYKYEYGYTYKVFSLEKGYEVNLLEYWESNCNFSNNCFSILMNKIRCDKIIISNNWLENLITMNINIANINIHDDIIEELEKYINMGFSFVNNSNIIHQDLEDIKSVINEHSSNNINNVSKLNKLTDLLLEHEIIPNIPPYCLEHPINWGNIYHISNITGTIMVSKDNINSVESDISDHIIDEYEKIMEVYYNVEYCNIRDIDDELDDEMAKFDIKNMCTILSLRGVGNKIIIKYSVDIYVNKEYENESYHINLDTKYIYCEFLTKE